MTDASIRPFTYDVAFSFAGENRAYVKKIADDLSARGVSVFYDKSAEAKLWGADLPEALTDIFHSQARCVVAFISADYIKKIWPMLELRAALARAMIEHEAYLLPVRLDDAELPPGLRWTVGTVDARTASQEKVVDLILQKLAMIPGRVAPEAIRIELLQQTPEEPLSNVSGGRLRTVLLGNDDLFLVMDLGGTKAYVSLMTSSGERLYDHRFSTESHDDAGRLLDFVKSSLRTAVDRVHEKSDLRFSEVTARIRAMGIAFPGPTDSEAGVVLDASNFHIKDFPQAERLRMSTFEVEIPTYIDNDVNLGVLGESWRGAARGYSNVVGIMIGTGIGGGIIIDGQIYRGRNKTAGEIGHMVVDLDSDQQCGCLQYGCFEALASRKAMARDLYKLKKAQNADPVIWNENNLGSNEIAYYYRKGDADAVAVVSRAAEICGKAVFSILNLFNPEIIVFNGGFVQQVGKMFLAPVLAEVNKCMNAVYSMAENRIPIELGTLPNPVLMGACKMAIDGSASRKEYTKKEILDLVVEGLGGKEVELLRSLARGDMPPPTTTRPGSTLHHDRVRPLRDRGLVRTDTGRGLSKSESVQITKLGKVVVEHLTMWPADQSP
jgi:glucokinase